MLDHCSDVVKKLKERYSTLHPLMVHRSIERAKSPGDLFDILDALSNDMNAGVTVPLVWQDEQRRWVKTDDIFQAMKFFKNRKIT